MSGMLYSPPLVIHLNAANKLPKSDANSFKVEEIFRSFNLFSIHI